MQNKLIANHKPQLLSLFPFYPVSIIRRTMLKSFCFFNNLSVFSVLFSALLFCGDFSHAESSIAVVNVDKAIAEADYTQGELEKLKSDSDFEENFKRYNVLREEMKTLQENAQINSLVWGDKEKKAFNEKAEDTVERLNQVGKVLDRKKQTVERDVQENMAPIINQAMKELIKANNLSVLLRADSVFFADPKLDLTEDLIRIINKLMPAGGDNN